MDSYEELFNKILQLNSNADQIVAYGEQCGAAGLMEYVDMNCGGIPDGEYAQIVDQSAPEQFLSMYRKIAENRFTLAVTTLLKANPAFRKPIDDFCGRTGGDCITLWNACIKEMNNEHSD